MSPKTPWFENETFWKATRPLLFSEARKANAAKEAKQIIALLKLRPGAKVLDLCCGIGRHSLELARRGFEVTGVDRNREYLKEAGKQARDEGLRLELVRSDMREFCRPGCFDAAINMYTSFGYFQDSRDDQRVARNLARSLLPKGALLIETMGREVLARIFRPRDWYEQAGYLVLEERKVPKDWSRIQSRWILIKGTRRQEFTFSLRLYSACGIRDLLQGAGFRRVEAYGGLAGAAYDRQAGRLVVVARKG
jgi:cyclopropane fatty-acyl-phospholipid synthase-like methyltransferase